VVGASLGGLAALIAQGETNGPLYKAIILVDITPQMDQRGALEVMQFMESTLSAGFDTLEEAAEIIARYTGRERRINLKGLAKNLRQGEDGKYRWHWDPNFLTLREDERGGPDRMIAATRAIDVPIMLVRGQDSNVVTEAVAREFLDLFPAASYVDVEKARHMVVGDKNEIFTNAIIGFLSTLD